MNLLDQIRDAGIVGAGGGGFPTHAKLSAKADYIILNGAECEPLLRVDQQLMELYADQVIRGFVAAGRLVQAQKALIGIKKKHKKVISIMREHIHAMNENSFVEIHELTDAYPVGDEHVLVFELTGRIVPEAGIPIHVGCVVINSETALNIDLAEQGKPVIEKYITLAGDVPNPVTVKVPVGMPLRDLIKLSGIDSLDGYKIIDGGPMMGDLLLDHALGAYDAIPINHVNGFVTKKTKGLVILKEDHPLVRKKLVKSEQARRVNRATCEQCRMCTDVCPRYLLGHNMQPHKIMRAMAYEIDELECLKEALLCSQCGVCELFSCPVGLYPKQANLYFKERLMAQNIRYERNKDEFEAQSMRQYRQVPSKRLIVRLGLIDFDKPAPFTEAPIYPDSFRIMTRHHVGAPAMPIVSTGDHVYAGQMIGRIPDDSLGAAIHASVSGVVTDVTDDWITIQRHH